MDKMVALIVVGTNRRAILHFAERHGGALAEERQFVIAIGVNPVDDEEQLGLKVAAESIPGVKRVSLVAYDPEVLLRTRSLKDQDRGKPGK